MFNYRLQDAKGKSLGVVSLDNEELPQMIKKGALFILSGWMLHNDLPKEDEFLTFVITPAKAKEAKSSGG